MENKPTEAQISDLEKRAGVVQESFAKILKEQELSYSPIPVVVEIADKPGFFVLTVNGRFNDVKKYDTPVAETPKEEPTVSPFVAQPE